MSGSFKVWFVDSWFLFFLFCLVTRGHFLLESGCGRVTYYKSLKKEKDAEMFIPFRSGLGGSHFSGTDGWMGDENVSKCGVLFLALCLEREG